MPITSNFDQDTKRQFVERLSFALTTDDDFGVDSMKYFTGGASESVRIRFKNGITKSLNVTGYSCRGILSIISKRV
jgi:hypothetical protein